MSKQAIKNMHMGLLESIFFNKFVSLCMIGLEMLSMVPWMLMVISGDFKENKLRDCNNII